MLKEMISAVVIEAKNELVKKGKELVEDGKKSYNELELKDILDMAKKGASFVKTKVDETIDKIVVINNDNPNNDINFEGFTFKGYEKTKNFSSSYAKFNLIYIENATGDEYPLMNRQVEGSDDVEYYLATTITSTPKK